MKASMLIFGILIALLGALWLLQGLGLVTMEPVLCFANCETVEGPAPLWAGAGAIAIVAGIFVIRFGVSRRGRK